MSSVPNQQGYVPRWILSRGFSSLSAYVSSLGSRQGTLVESQDYLPLTTGGVTGKIDEPDRPRSPRWRDRGGRNAVRMSESTSVSPRAALARSRASSQATTSSVGSGSFWAPFDSGSDEFGTSLPVVPAISAAGDFPMADRLRNPSTQGPRIASVGSGGYPMNFPRRQQPLSSPRPRGFAGRFTRPSPSIGNMSTRPKQYPTDFLPGKSPIREMTNPPKDGRTAKKLKVSRGNIHKSPVSNSFTDGTSQRPDQQPEVITLDDSPTKPDADPDISTIYDSSADFTRDGPFCFDEGKDLLLPSFGSAALLSTAGPSGLPPSDTGTILPDSTCSADLAPSTVETSPSSTNKAADQAQQTSSGKNHKRYCKLCEVRYTEDTVDHRRTQQHKANKAMINPVCADCKEIFNSATTYLQHCLLVHNKAATLRIDNDETQNSSVGLDEMSDDESVKSDSNLDEELFVEKDLLVEKQKDLVVEKQGSVKELDRKDNWVNQVSNDEREPIEKATTTTLPTKCVQKPKDRTSNRRLPDFVVPACYCNLCCTFFHDVEKVIHLHCQSRKHREGLEGAQSYFLKNFEDLVTG